MRALAKPLFLLLALVVGAAWATTGAAAEEDRLGRGLLWKIERGDVAASYVLGTIHLSDDRIRTLPEPIAKAFEGADSLSIEVLVTPEVEAQAVVAMLPGPDEPLDKVLPPDLYAALLARAARYLPKPESIRHLKPWAALELLGLPPSEFKRQAAGERPLDFWLQDQAACAGKRVYGLESGAEHIDALAGLPLGAQVAMLRNLVQGEDPEVGLKFARLVYETRDLRALAAMQALQMAGVGPADGAAVQAHLIDDRNRLMVERMAPRLAEGNAFIAVGALHLPGEHGILRLLERQGYTVSAVY